MVRRAIKHDKDKKSILGRALVECISLLSVVVLTILYTNTMLFLPLLIKIVFSLITWFSVRNVYRHSFGSFSTKDTDDIIFWLA